MTEILTDLAAQWAPVWQKLPALFIGLRYTAIVAFTAYAASLVLGLLVVILRRSPDRLAANPRVRLRPAVPIPVALCVHSIPVLWIGCLFGHGD